MSTYFEVHPDNPQPRTVAQVVAMLRDDALIAYPTDSGYALGCRVGNGAGVDRIKRLRELDAKHHFTLVCHDFAQLGEYVRVSNPMFRLISACTPGPYTFILPATREVPANCCTRRSGPWEFESPTARWHRRCSRNWANP